MQEFIGQAITGSKKEDLVGGLINTFSREVPVGNLIWNCFREVPDRYSYDDLPRVPVPDCPQVYFYLERTDVLYETTLGDVFAFVRGLEPWAEVDAYVFDVSLRWVIALTHEDLILTLGL